MGRVTVTGYRPKGGRRPEDFPTAVARDEAVLDLLRKTPGGLTRNKIADGLGEDRRKITYSLARLRRRRLVGHWPEGEEGHGFWCLTLRARMDSNRSGS